jgi:glycosyltransferase involved in cell wall biosynthesis
MPDRLRVLICVPWGKRLGGAEVMLWSVLRHTDARRVEFQVAFLEQGPFEEEVAGLGLRTFAIPAGRLREPRAAGAAVRRLSRIIGAEEPHLVLNWTTKSQLYGATAAISARRDDSVLWWQHGVSDGSWLDRVATALPARAIGCSSRVSAAAQATTRPRRPTFVVHPGVDTERISALNRATLGISEDVPVVGMVGRLQPGKGQHRFLHSLRRLHDGGCRAHGIMVGGTAHGLSPGYEAEVRAIVPRLGLEEWVTMVGQVPDARPYIAAMDVLISPSVNESFGIVLAEALVQGVPVIAVSDAGAREVVQSGLTGLLVPRADPPVLAAATYELLDDEPRRRAIALAGRRAAVERFSAQAMTRALERQLRTLSAREGTA